MKRLVKGILLIILIVLPIHDSHGEMLSIRDLFSHAHEDEALEWNQTYNAYGRTVQVNVPVIIPDVDNFPIIQVSAQRGNTAVEKAGLSKAADQTDAGDGISYEDKNIISYLYNSPVSKEIATFYCTDPEKLDYAFSQVYNHDPRGQRRGNWGFITDYYYPYEVNAETIFAESNNLSLADAENALKSLLTYYYGDAEADIEMDYIEVRGRARKKTGRRVDDLGEYKKDYPKGTYCLHYRQKMKEIPVYMEISCKALTTKETRISRDVALKCARIRPMSEVNEFEFMDFSSFYMNAVLLKEECILEEDVPLASLDKIIDRLEKEINEGRIREVYALRLGYVCYLDEGSPETYTLHPAWICDCIYTETAKESIMENITTDAFRENFRYEQIIVDAQTCELQAGWIAEDEGLFHSAPITWDGV